MYKLPIIAAILAFSMVCSANAYGQLRIRPAHSHPRPIAKKVTHFLFGEPSMPRDTPREYWGNSRINFGTAHGFQQGVTLPLLREDDSWGPYPKYYGGFHSSHFSNIGIPHGDRGFRDNGIYWTPW